MISEVAPGLFLLPVPISIPLKTVNCYLIRGAGGWTVVDCGFHEPQAEAAWREAFAALGISPGQVEQILVTHYHPDHYGASGWLQQQTGAPVRMYRREAAAVDLFWNPARGQAAAVGALFAAHGTPPEMVAALMDHHHSTRFILEPHPEITPFGDDAPLRLGDRAFEVVWLPGHTDGLPVFWCAAERLLLANDMILAGISPNISWLPHCDPDPLGQFLRSLERVAALPAALTLTGHRRLITDLSGRVRELIAHHHERLALVTGLAAAGGRDGATAWAVNLGLFGEQPTVHNTRFAMAEALAHLEYLAQRGRLERVGREPVRYRVPAAG